MEATGGKRAMSYRILSILFFLAAAVMMWGVVALVGGWFDNTDDGIHKVHTVGWGVLMGVIVTGGLFLGMWRAARRIASLQQAIVGVLALLIAGAAAASWDIVGFGALILLVPLLILLAVHPARHEFFARGDKVSIPLATFTVIAAVPLVTYALDMSSAQRSGLLTDPHVKDDHWTIMAAMALALILCGALASLRTRGWPFVAWSAGLGATLFGVASVSFPHHAGSVGTGWGIAAIVGGLFFIVQAEMDRRGETIGEFVEHLPRPGRHAPAA